MFPDNLKSAIYKGDRQINVVFFIEFKQLNLKKKIFFRQWFNHPRYPIVHKGLHSQFAHVSALLKRMIPRILQQTHKSAFLRCKPGLEVFIRIEKLPDIFQAPSVIKYIFHMLHICVYMANTRCLEVWIAGLSEIHKNIKFVFCLP